MEERKGEDLRHGVGGELREQEGKGKGAKRREEVEGGEEKKAKEGIVWNLSCIMWVEVVMIVMMVMICAISLFLSRGILLSLFHRTKSLNLVAITQ